jgi:hypothetical protein
MDASEPLMEYLSESGRGKKGMLKVPDAKSDYF